MTKSAGSISKTEQQQPLIARTIGPSVIQTAQLFLRMEHVCSPMLRHQQIKF